LQEWDQREESEDSENTEKLDRIEEGIKALSSDEIPRLKAEIRELRKLLADRGYGREDEATS
jgi:phage-related protein